ncbi:hypothetical protein PHYBOEH_010800 [Phytophthora boehmeriae]|uniref:Cytosolic carboxypeptidase-like protein 5 n=1 Tax=Phytophthora boehmeriae TaxID=109152 RepID=A0A8T1VQQ0_9STRA|nr:hypothetical protein PHYBOEH_010800 [Phytophthora boehmeriae]
MASASSWSSTPDEDADEQVLHRLATSGSGKTAFEFMDGALRFSSRFDGGNMANVQETETGAFHIQLAEDAASSGVSTGYSTWFYFEIERDARNNNNSKKTQEIRLVLTNMNPQRGLYKNGYTVIYCPAEVEELPSSDNTFQNEKLWNRLPTPLEFEKYTVSAGQTSQQQNIETGVKASERHADDESEDLHVAGVSSSKLLTKTRGRKLEIKMKVSWTYRFKFARERVRFAFCYPYTYTRVQRELAEMDRRFIRPKELQRNNSNVTPETEGGDIYYHRELLTRSLEGLRVDLITISSLDGITSSRMPSHRKFQALSSSEESAFCFDPKQKKMVIISARVHPGESPANFMLDGMLQLLLHSTGESAIALRRQFVFKIIPMLNPDGVCSGCYRTDSRGVNLNRVYEDPQPHLAPTVFALKEFILELITDYGGVDSTTAQKNMVYLDLHAHSNRRGCFVYGNNHLQDASLGTSIKAMEADIARQVQTQLYARLVSLHTPFFDYMACSFDKDNMSRNDLRDNNNAPTSRQGSSRVALYRATGLTYVYTIECNYNEGRRTLRSSSLAPASSLPTHPVPTSSGVPKHRSSSKSSSKHHQLEKQLLPRQAVPKSGTRLYLKFSPAEWKDVGVGALVALLDLFELPGAGDKLGQSPFRSRDGLEKNILAEVRAAMSDEDGKQRKQSSRQIGKSKAML